MTSATVEAVLEPVIAREGGAPDGWAAQLEHYLELLLDHNARVNLVSRRTAGDALTRHVLPSLAVLRVVRPGDRIHVLDVGSGGGFPGVPLRILRPDIRLDLVEATRKKCVFLEECITRLGLEGSAVHHCRIEDPSDLLRDRAPFGMAVARAVGSGARLRKAVSRLVEPGAAFWVFAPPGDRTPIRWDDAAGTTLTGLRDLLA